MTAMSSRAGVDGGYAWRLAFLSMFTTHL